MTSIIIRPGTREDLDGAAELLNAIIEAGGTTALTKVMTPEELGAWMAVNPEKSAWHVAAENNIILGFQWIGPLDRGAADIATFVKIGETGKGIGSKLFEMTRKIAKELGYLWIHAEIRADNTGGLKYYESRGFQDYGRFKDYRLENGQIVDKILKRYDL